MTTVVEAVDLRRTYKTTTGTFRRGSVEVEAVRGISFEIQEGELFGLLGPNGAGKTTTIKMLITLLIPTSGTARVLGHDVVKDAKWVRQRIGYVFGGDRGLYERLSALDNLRYFAELYGVDPKVQRARIHELLELVGLDGREKERVEGYSRGMRQRLHIARGILHDPPVVFLDEPSIGVDPVGARELRSMIAGLRDAGKTVLLTTHYMFEADELCDRIAVVAQGEIVAQGTPRDLKQGVGEGAIVEIEVYGIGDDALAAVRALDGVTGVVVEERDQAQAIVIQTAVGAEVTQAIMAQLDGRQARPRDDARADARGCVRRARHRSRAGGISHEPAAAHDDARLEAALQAGVAQPVLPLHRDRHAVDLRDDGVLPLPGRREAGDPRRGCRGLGHDGHLVADDDRGRRGVAAPAAARDPRAPRRLADAVLGHVPADHARDRRRSASTRSRRDCSTSGSSSACRSRSTTGPRSSSPSRRRSSRSGCSAS